MFLHIVNVTYRGGYRLELHFNDGAVKAVDLQNELHGEVFEPLQKIDFFRQVTINPDTQTVEWPNGADFAPEFLHQIGKTVRQSA